MSITRVLTGLSLLNLDIMIQMSVKLRIQSLTHTLEYPLFCITLFVKNQKYTR
jgi:hypothetical protein